MVEKELWRRIFEKLSRRWIYARNNAPLTVWMRTKKYREMEKRERQMKISYLRLGISSLEYL
jgi:hypothetical protein